MNSISTDDIATLLATALGTERHLVYRAMMHHQVRDGADSGHFKRCADGNRHFIALSDGVVGFTAGGVFGSSRDHALKSQF